MAGKRLRVVDPDGAEPIANRIATALHKVGLASKHQTWKQANEDGLSPTQGQILAALAASGPLTGTEIAGQLGVTLPTVSDSVKALAAKSLVAKEPDPRHPRASLVSLTATGRERATRASAWPEFLAQAATSLSDAEQRALFAGLVKMIRTLQETGQIPTSRMCVTCVHFRANVHAGPRPHHCGLVDAPLADDRLRIDCPDHDEASDAQRAATWEHFSAPR